MAKYDWSNPDSMAVLQERARRVQLIKTDAEYVASCRVHYRSNPWDFINDWGMTYDPRLLERGINPSVPFILWGKQEEYLRWVYDHWQNGERGLVEKSRDCGVTWLSVALAVSLWCFHDGVAIGFGSRKEALVDTLGDPDSIFEKIRHFVGALPIEFLPKGYNPRDHSKFMKLLSPETEASITGEAGDNIGRGGRKSIQFVDEAAFIERQKAVDAALSQTTNCQIDISTFNGSGNEFFIKQQKFYGTHRHFIFDWKDDPRKDDAWYQKQKAEQSEETVAQEIDRDPNASNTDSFIPAKWVAASVDAHIRLGFKPSGIRTVGFDPADTGDAKGLTKRYGSVIMDAEQKLDGDITDALPWAYEEADAFRTDLFIYDADGMGAPVIKVSMKSQSAGRFHVIAYYGSGEIYNKNARSIPSDNRSKLNSDLYVNYRAQSATWLRNRFKNTYDAIQRLEKGLTVNIDPNKMISISSECTDLLALQSELSRPMRIFTDNGKIKVESKKAMKQRQIQSPNLFDSTVIAFSESRIPRQSHQSYEPE